MPISINLYLAQNITVKQKFHFWMVKMYCKAYSRILTKVTEEVCLIDVFIF